MKSKSTIYGYIRVSSKDQNIERQLDALAAFPVEVKRIYTDKLSGKNFDRPNYKKLVRRLHSGDVLVILSIDRLGRNYEEILEQWRIITKKIGTDIVVLDFPLLDTRARQNGSDLTGRFVADLVLQILAYTAEKERDNIRQRQAEGIAAAHARGVRWGNQDKHFPADFDSLYQQWKAGEMDTATIMQRCGMKHTAFYKHLKEYEAAIIVKAMANATKND